MYKTGSEASTFMKKSLLWILTVLCMLLLPAQGIFAASQPGCAGGAGCAHVAQIGATHYDTLAEAFQASTDQAEIILLKDTSVDAIIEVRASVTLNLNGKTIQNKLTKERLFHVYAPGFTVNGRTAGSSMEIPADNAESYGFVKILAPSAVTLDGGTYTGSTANGSFVRVLGDASGSTVVMNDLQATTNYEFIYTNTLSTPAETPTLRVQGGVYTTKGKAFGIDTLNLSPVSFSGVTVTAGTGPVLEASGSNVTLEDCDFRVTNTQDSSHFEATAVAVSYSGAATIKSGSYVSSGYGVYVYSSGGKIVIEDGVVQGGVAAARADVTKAPSIIEIRGGEISGPLETGPAGSGNVPVAVDVYGGIFDHDVTANVVPSVARHGTFATLTSGGSTRYYVGTPKKVASDLARTAKENDVIQIEQGSVDLSGLAPHITVQNNGGTVIVNGENVQQGESVLAHDFGTAWLFDDKNHWHVCSTCDRKSDIAAHTSDAGTITTPATEATMGEKTYRCTVCRAVLKTELLAILPPNVPKTGDSSHVALWLLLMALASAGIAALRPKAQH